MRGPIQDRALVGNKEGRLRVATYSDAIHTYGVDNDKKAESVTLHVGLGSQRILLGHVVFNEDGIHLQVREHANIKVLMVS